MPDAGAAASPEDHSSQLRQAMVCQLEQAGGIRSAPVRDVFLAEPRERYVPEIAERDGLEVVYNSQTALVTVRDSNGEAMSSSSAPAVMAPMLEALKLANGMQVLEIGVGTGYNAALMKRLVGHTGTVISLEVDPVIAQDARDRLARYGHEVDVVVTDGRRGWRESSPFHRVIATASAAAIPKAWRDMLAEEGLLVVPFRFGPDHGAQAVIALRRQGPVLQSETVFPGYFMPLRDIGAVRSPLAREPRLEASSVLDGQRVVLARLAGEQLAELSRSDRRHLLSLVLSAKRTMAELTADKAFGLQTFIALHPDLNPLRCNFDGRPATGLAGPGGRGFAAVSGGFGQAGTVDVWGEPEAEEIMAAVLCQWELQGSPELTDLRVTIVYEGSPPGRTEAWRACALEEGTMLLSWHT